MGSSAVSPSIYVPGKVRTTQTPLFDTYVVPQGQTVGGTLGKVSMFSQSVGVQNTSWPNGVPINITNLQQNNQLQGGQSFLTRAIRAVLIGCAETDVINLMKQCDMQFVIGTGNYAYCDAPPEFWAGGAGSYTPGTGTASTNGVPDSRSIYCFDVDPILLTDGTNFRVNLLFGTTFTASQDFWLRVYLEGQKTEPAQ